MEFSVHTGGGWENPSFIELIVKRGDIIKTFEFPVNRDHIRVWGSLRDMIKDYCRDKSYPIKFTDITRISYFDPKEPAGYISWDVLLECLVTNEVECKIEYPKRITGLDVIRKENGDIPCYLLGGGFIQATGTGKIYIRTDPEWFEEFKNEILDLVEYTNKIKL
jgi:hypothetical protein